MLGSRRIPPADDGSKVEVPSAADDGRAWVSSDEFYQRLFENNRDWVRRKLEVGDDYFERLAQGQAPEVLYIGCSDSRVTAEELMGAEPGQVFVHRNIANVVSNSDLNVLSVIEFAVSHLGVKHIIVCGHYECGGVRAAMQPRDLGLLNPWLRNIRDVYRMHHDELSAISDESARYRRLIELNVEEQCVNVIKTAAVQRTYLARGYPIVHGCVVDLATGLLKDLDIDFDAKLERIRHVYDLGAS
ncbi:MAG: carbonic anhydrase [Deltaproteobacteria bacterium]|nr:carbonic anhydrase [Deltaproteobacteria bacterium]MBK8713497.1 carbonic anhydrase [Deltaproteobacteria bacterium]MBP7289962.1 carbonic anhydrase [Nannocystaceae bacterium]